MDHKSHIGFVDSHPKRYGGDDDVYLIMHPFVLHCLLESVVHLGVVVVSTNVLLDQLVSHLFGVLPR